MTIGERFEKLVHIMHRLRAPGGCPWDAEQSHASIKPYLIEEAFEVVEAIEAENDQELCTELGDLLLQVVFHAEMASERKAFLIADVVDAICEKMVRRHPHVFADTAVSGADEVLRNWSRIKREERRDEADNSALAGVPRGMPALLRAQRLGEKAASAGFDWRDTRGVLDKLREELDEIEAAVAIDDKSQVTAELGDLLLAATSLARHLGLNSEDAVRGASERFAARFRWMEQNLKERRREMHDLSEAEKDELWAQAKVSQTDS